MSEFDGTFIPALRTVAMWVIDQPSFSAVAAIFREIFSRHHFPVRCVTFYTRVCERIYIVYSAKQLFPCERDYFSVDLIFDGLHQYL